ncbi:MAG: hypothetical protein BWY88_00485 [Synergistetes bacterium ADurb.Bin520]|nr:MAG: hypothetical protein BWY88_00485 [Synergistetes bacterium ADurb.Bin520]
MWVRFDSTAFIWLRASRASVLSGSMRCMVRRTLRLSISENAMRPLKVARLDFFTTTTLSIQNAV